MAKAAGSALRKGLGWLNHPLVGGPLNGWSLILLAISGYGVLRKAHVVGGSNTLSAALIAVPLLVLVAVLLLRTGPAHGARLPTRPIPRWTGGDSHPTSGLYRQPIECPKGHAFETQVVSDGRGGFRPTKPTEYTCPRCGATNGHTTLHEAVPVEWATTVMPKYRVRHFQVPNAPRLAAHVGDYVDYARARRAAEDIAADRHTGVVTIESGNEIITRDGAGHQRGAYWGELAIGDPDYRFEEIAARHEPEADAEGETTVPRGNTEQERSALAERLRQVADDVEADDRGFQPRTGDLLPEPAQRLRGYHLRRRAEAIDAFEHASRLHAVAGNLKQRVETPTSDELPGLPEFLRGIAANLETV